MQHPGPAASFRREDLPVLVVVCLGIFLFFNSLGSITVALPTIQRDFGSSLAATQWVQIMGVVMLATVSLCAGKASGTLGRRRLFILGVTLYALGAGLSATAASLPQLLVFRAIMTFGLAIAAPMGPTILATTFPERRGQVLGFYASALAVGQATGPTTGGLILSAWGWQAVFLANLILGSLIAVAVFAVLRGREARQPEPFDYTGAAFLIAGYPPLLIALSLGNSEGWSAPVVIACFAVSAVGLSAFILAELRAANPLLRLAYFRRLGFSIAIISLIATSIVWQPVNFFAPLYLGNVLGLSAIMLGLMLSALPAATFFSSPLSGRLSDRVDTRHLVAIGLASLVGGCFAYSRLGVDPNYAFVVLALALVGMGYGIFTPANQTLAFSTVSPLEYGLIAAMLTSIGTAIGTIGNTIAVAIAEDNLAGRRVTDPAGFTDAQQIVFTLLLAPAILGLVITVVARIWRRRTVSESAAATPP